MARKPAPTADVCPLGGVAQWIEQRHEELACCDGREPLWPLSRHVAILQLKRFRRRSNHPSDNSAASRYGRLSRTSVGLLSESIVAWWARSSSPTLASPAVSRVTPSPCGCQAWHARGISLIFRIRRGRSQQDDSLGTIFTTSKDSTQRIDPTNRVAAHPWAYGRISEGCPSPARGGLRLLG